MAWLRARPVAAAGGLIAVGLVAVLAVARPGGRGEDGAVFVVQSAPMISVLTVAGVVVPGEAREVTAPFEGTVTQVSFAYGQQVNAGQTLLVMDEADVRQRQREAQVAYFKAQQTAGEMADWAASPEVARARRTLASAELEAQALGGRLAETKRLLDRGIVPRNEYDDLVQQQRTQEITLASARAELAAALARGQGAGRAQAQVELEAARARLNDLNAQLARAVVTAPAAGVLVRPPRVGDAAAPDVRAGARLVRGQPIATLALTDSFAVAAQVDEADAIRLRPGQSVMVTGPGIGDEPIAGVIDQVAGEGAGSGPEGKAATFAIRARLGALTPAQRQRIRFGMSANMAITLAQKPTSVMVPAEAVQGAFPATFVRVRDRGGLRVRRVPVVLGAETAQGVEIIAGLKPGDRVILPAAN